MKRFIIIISILFSIAFLYIFIAKPQQSNKNILQISGINHYDPELYSIPLTVFPAEIPSSAHVLSYTYYNYWHEAEDIYLELKFDNLKDMEDYLFNVKQNCLDNCHDYTPLNNNSWFLETENIYN